MGEATPLVSVVMSVFNEEKYIEESIRSILQQTVQDFEIIVVDDCSTDRTAELLERFRDKRIRLIKNNENRGLTRNLNKGLEYAAGKYIARMDGDDICLPERFGEQIRYLEEHPECMLISCQTRTFGEQALVWRLKDGPEELRARMLIRPVLAHPGFMMRRELVFEKGYRYDESFRSAQDYDFAVRVSEHYPIGIAPKVLLQYRAHSAQVSARGGGLQRQNADRVRDYQWRRLGAEFTEEQRRIYKAWVLEEKTQDVGSFAEAWKLIGLLLEANQKSCVYDSGILECTLKKLFFDWILHNKNVLIYCKLPSICGCRPKDYFLFLKEALSIIRSKALR